jgi:hypothetical protein
LSTTEIVFNAAIFTTDFGKTDSDAFSPLVPTLEPHYYKKKSFARRFGKGLGGGQDFQPSRLMHRINRAGHFLLITAS